MKNELLRECAICKKPVWLEEFNNKPFEKYYCSIECLKQRGDI